MRTRTTPPASIRDNLASRAPAPARLLTALLVCSVAAGAAAQPTLGTGGRGVVTGDDDSGRGSGRGVLGRDETGDPKPINPPTPGRTDPGPMTELHGIEGLTVSDHGSMGPYSAGEITSVVVPPFLKDECPAGRLLVSIDGDKDPEGGRIVGLDIDALSDKPTEATFSGYFKTMWIDGAEVEVRRIKSNDQEMAVLPNGDVLYMRMGQTRMFLTPKPDWFDHAYKITPTDPPWGPGARSEIFVFRSADCGGTFGLVGRIDTAAALNGRAGLPQWAGGLPQTCDTCPLALPDGTEVYQMAGTDGPLLKVDPETGHAFLSVWIAGHHPEATAAGDPFRLLDAEIAKTAILRSIDGGATWDVVDVLDYRGWRLEITPVSKGYLSFSAGYFLNRRALAPAVPPGGPVLGFDDMAVLTGTYIHWPQGLGPSNVTSLRAQTIGARLPDPESQVLMVRDTIDKLPTGRKGWRAFSFDWSAMAEGFSEFVPPIMSEGDGRTDFVFNPVIVDAGRGPLLVYWHDVRTDAAGDQMVKLRGRLLLGKRHQTKDFTIRTAFPVTGRQFFGHYQMAGGFHRIEPSGLRRTVFFPVWVQPDDKVHFAKVELRTEGPPPHTLGETRPGVVAMSAARRTPLAEMPDLGLSADWHEEHEAEETRLEELEIQGFESAPAD